MILVIMSAVVTQAQLQFDLFAPSVCLCFAKICLSFTVPSLYCLLSIFVKTNKNIKMKGRSDQIKKALRVMTTREPTGWFPAAASFSGGHQCRHHSSPFCCEHKSAADYPNFQHNGILLLLGHIILFTSIYIYCSLITCHSKYSVFITSWFGSIDSSLFCYSLPL